MSGKSISINYLRVDMLMDYNNIPVFPKRESLFIINI